MTLCYRFADRHLTHSLHPRTYHKATSSGSSPCSLWHHINSRNTGRASCYAKSRGIQQKALKISASDPLPGGKDLMQFTLSIFNKRKDIIILKVFTPLQEAQFNQESNTGDMTTKPLYEFDRC